MRILVEHNRHGKIISIATPSTAASAAGTMTLVARPGHKVTELDAPHVRSADDYDHLAAIKREYQVEGRAGEHRLVRKRRKK